MLWSCFICVSMVIIINQKKGTLIVTLNVSDIQMRKLIRQLINGALLEESREQKQQFYTKVRSKYPDMDNAFFVMWWGDGIYDWSKKELKSPVWDTTRLYLSDLLEKVGPNTTFDISSNLVDPSGRDILPHGGDWGSVGIVFQGIPTIGYNRDIGSGHRDRMTDRARFDGLAGEYNPFKELYTSTSGLRTYANVDGKHTRLEAEGPSQLTFNPDISSKPFLTHQPGFQYSYNEFAVVPKKIVGIVYHNDLGFVGGDSDTWATLGVAEVDPDHAGNKMRELGRSFGLPVSVGPAEIGVFYRSLYGNNQ
jgi:hypothetical protein